MNTDTQPVLLNSFVIRLWLQPSAEKPQSIRISVTEANTGQRVGFVSLDAAFAFIVSQTELPN